MMYVKDFMFRIVAFIAVVTLINLEQHQYVQGAEYRRDLYRCPQGLGSSMLTFRDKCYRFVATDRNWNQAQADCVHGGGNLVHIKDRATQDFIWNAARKELGWTVNGMWIGAHDQRQNRNLWEWVKTSTHNKGDPIHWNFWDSGQPSCGASCIEFCGQLRFDEGGRWHDYECAPGFWFITYNYHYCCMYDMAPPTTIRTTTRSTKATTTTTKLPTTTTLTTTTATTTANSTTTVKDTNRPRSTGPSSTNGIDATGKSASSDQSGGSSTFSSVAEGQSANIEASGGDEVMIAAIVVGSLVALFLLLLLVFFVRRRKQKKILKEAPSENFPNPTYNGGMGLPGHAAAFVNPQTDAYDIVNLPPVAARPTLPSELNKENPYSVCMENELNACAAATDEHVDDGSKGIYDDIEFDIPSDMSDSDDDCEKASATKAKTPSVEYLHARSLQQPNPTYLTAAPSAIQETDEVFDLNRQSAIDNIYGPHPTTGQSDE